MATIQRFEDMVSWQLVREVAKEVYVLTRTGAMAKDFGLVDQIRHSSGSVMDNIAEGFDRGSRGEFVQFLGCAKGSAGEVKTQLYRALDQNYLSETTFTNLIGKLDTVGAALKGMLRYLSKTPPRGERYQQVAEPLVAYQLPEFLCE